MDGNDRRVVGVTRSTRARLQAASLLLVACMAAGVRAESLQSIWPVVPGDPVEGFLGDVWNDGDSLPIGVSAVLDQSDDWLVIRVGDVDGLVDGSTHVLDLANRRAWHIRPLQVLESARLSPDNTRIAGVLSSLVENGLIVYTIEDGSSRIIPDVQAVADTVSWLDENTLEYQPYSSDGEQHKPAIINLAALPITPPVETVYSCGGVNDDCQCGANDPYPCCSNGGNCTWWAWEQACCNWGRALPGWGDAHSWIDGANGSNYPVSTTPAVGTIACDANNVLSPRGHVVWVEQVSSTQVYVSEQNCDGGYGVNRRWYNRSVFSGYIYNQGGTVDPCSGSDSAQFVSESWPHDNDTVNTNQSFSKSWTMKNNGSSTWKKSCNHKWAFDGGTNFGAPEYSDLGDSESIAPNQTKTWTLNMTAPSTPGTYQGWYKMDRYGTGRFGDRVWILINVVTPTPAPTIASSPSSASSCPGGSVTFNMSASGQSLSYRWQFNGNDIGDGGHYSGTGDTTLTVSAIDGSVGGNYRCKVSNPGGTVYTSEAGLSVRASTSINAQPAAKAVCPGGSATFSITASGDGGLSYQWQKNGGNLSENGHYSGVNGSTLNVTNVNSGDAASYRCIVNAGCGSATSAEAVLTFIEPLQITGHPAGEVLCTGQSTILSVAATGSSLAYQWRRDSANLADGEHYQGTATSSLTIQDLDASVAGSYQCVVSNPCGSSASNSAMLTVLPLTVISQAPANQYLCAGQAATFGVEAAGAGTLTYQWQKDGVDLTNSARMSGVVEPTLSITEVTPADAGDYVCLVTADCGIQTSAVASLWLKTPTTVQQQPAELTVCEGQLARFMVTAVGEGPLTFQWQKNGTDVVDGQGVSGATTQMLQIAPAALDDAGSYRVRITAECGSVDSEPAGLTVQPLTVIQDQPVPLIASAGSPATFSIVASGVDLVYQWRRGNVNLVDGPGVSGSQSPTLSLASVTASDRGAYRCMVSGSCGVAAVSEAANLSVVAPLLITAQPQSVTVRPAGTARFAVAASGASLTYQWFKDSSALLDDDRIQGSRLAVLTILRCTATDAGSYYCLVTSSTDSANSQMASLTLGAGTGSAGPAYGLVIVDVNAGSSVASSADYSLAASIAQSGSVGELGGESAMASDGFWAIWRVVMTTWRADFDRDGDVDTQDVETLQGCATGPGMGPPASGCELADIDGDDDVDQVDFGEVQRCLTAPGAWSDVSCQ